MRYLFKHASAVTYFEEKQIKKLKIELGTIWDDFEEEKQRNTTYVILVYDGDKIIAWGLLFWDRIPKQWDFSVYVKRKWRRQKIGTKIYNKMKRKMKLKNEEIEGHRHDTASMMFFDKLQAKR